MGGNSIAWARGLLAEWTIWGLFRTGRWKDLVEDITQQAKRRGLYAIVDIYETVHHLLPINGLYKSIEKTKEITGFSS